MRYHFNIKYESLGSRPKWFLGSWFIGSSTVGDIIKVTKDQYYFTVIGLRYNDLVYDSVHFPYDIKGKPQSTDCEFSFIDKDHLYFTYRGKTWIADRVKS